MSKVYLVGAGPGDPELITLKGRRVLEEADAVLYDHLASRALLDLAPPSAERLYVGEESPTHAFTQETASALLIERARRGLTVVRLEGGDPFFFGHGGEEAEALAGAGIEFEIVPGVTTSLGAAACAGVPLTLGEHTPAVSFVNGHHIETIDWSSVGMSETLVIYMGLTAFPAIARELIARGRAASTPAIAVRWATRADQETVNGTLETLPSLIAQYGLQPPATIIVGDVVRLAPKLDWFSRRPLFGKSVVVTRAREQGGALVRQLCTLGAHVINLPTIEIQPAGDAAPLDQALAHLADYDWLIFTSANGVRCFAERLDRSGSDLRSLRARLCAIGPATRDALAALHLKTDLMGQEYVAESLLAAFDGVELAGRRVLLPRAAVARDLVPVELARRGAIVDVVEAYRTVMPADTPRLAAAIFSGARKPDCIAFSSSSTVRNLVTAAGAEALRGVAVVTIGPVTSATARELGLTVAREASVFTVEGLLQAIRAVCETEHS